MTKSQERAITNLRRCVEKDYLYDEQYEIKRWEIEELKYGKISVVFTTGLKNDDGTLASIFCRDTGHVFIGKKGGMCCYNTKTMKQINVKYYETWKMVKAFEGR